MRQLTIRELLRYWEGASQKLKAGQDAIKAGTFNSYEFSVGLLMPPEIPAWDNLCSDLNWHTGDINSGYYSEASFGFVGVYRLIAYNNGASAGISRFCGVDDTGTLYIGKAGRLHERLNQLRRSYKNGKRESTHAPTSILKHMHNYPFPGEPILIASLFTASNMADIVERDLLGAYRHQFGELPPLNVNTK